MSLSTTGIVVALHGKETGAGDFLVQEVLEAGLPPQIDRPIKSSITSLSFTSCNASNLLKHMQRISIILLFVTW